MATRRRRRLGQAFQSLAGTMGNLFQQQAQMGLSRQAEERETKGERFNMGMQALIGLLGDLPPEIIPQVLPMLLRSLESGKLPEDVSAFMPEVPGVAERPPVAAMLEQIGKVRTPEEAAGLGAPELAHGTLRAAGVAPIRKSQVPYAPGGTIGDIEMPGTAPEPSPDWLEGMQLLRGAGGAREEALSPFIKREPIEEMLPTGEQVKRFPKVTEMPEQVTTGLPPSVAALNELRAQLGAAASPEGGRLSDIERERGLKTFGAEQGIITQETAKRQQTEREAQEAIKATEARAEAQKRADASADQAEGMIANIDQLLSPAGGLTKGAKRVVGPMRMPAAIARSAGGEFSTIQSAIDQMVGQQVLDLMKALKEQSKTGATGFGQLSEGELALMSQSATRLTNQAQAEAEYARLLRDLRQQLQKVRAVAGREPQAGASNIPAVLEAAPPGVHTLSDGSVWIKHADGRIEKR